VDGLRAAFVGNWAETGQRLSDEHDRFPDQPQPGNSVVQIVQCPSQVGWSAMCTALTALIGSATTRIRVTTAYFVPDEFFLDQLCAAARRGVDVAILVPGEHVDKRVVQAAGEADYEPLLDAGVHIWRFDPTMLHAKVVTVDGLVATVGSANFDNRSLRLNEEANAVIFDPAVVAVLDGQFREDLARSSEVSLGEWRARGLVQRVQEAVTELFDDQL
jgi:cardiolipin synthase